MNPSFVRNLLWSIIIGLVAAIAYLYFWQPTRLSRSINTFVSTIAPSLGSVQFPYLSFGSLNQPTTVLFMGTDVVYSGSGRHLNADKVALNGRSDTMMLVFLNPYRNKVGVLNIPRDTEVSLGKYGVQKINGANAIGGPECARQAVTTLTDVPVDHYVVMNVTALVDLVNELGGVTVEIPKKMSYMDWTAKLKIDLTPGTHTLTGNQAMGFVRFRHDELGDIGRVQRQQMFMRAVMHKMLDPRSWVHVPKLVEIAKGNIQTDLSDVNICEYLNFVHNVPKENIKFVMLPGQFAGNGDWIAGPYTKMIAAQLARPDEEIVTSRRNITVCIKNATADKTFGWKLSQALRKLGYLTSIARDEPDALSSKTRIIAQDGNTANANMLKQDLGNIGQIVGASVGNLYTSITLIAHDDIDLTRINLSSADAPYVEPLPMPQPLLSSKKLKRSNQADSETDQMNPLDQTDQSDQMNQLKPVDEQPESTEAPPTEMNSQAQSQSEEKPNSETSPPTPGTTPEHSQPESPGKPSQIDLTPKSSNPAPGATESKAASEAKEVPPTAEGHKD